MTKRTHICPICRPDLYVGKPKVKMATFERLIQKASDTIVDYEYQLGLRKETPLGRSESGTKDSEQD